MLENRRECDMPHLSVKEQLTGRHKIMTITRGLAAAAMLAGLAVGTASTAWADTPTMSGTYRFEAQNSPSEPWIFTSCGDGCAETHFLADPRFQSPAETVQAHLVNGQWTMDDPHNAVACPDRTTLQPASSHYTWDPFTLAGTQLNTTTAAGCYGGVGVVETPLAFHLTKVS
jgi:hypothetical protein